MKKSKLYQVIFKWIGGFGGEHYKTSFIVAKSKTKAIIKAHKNLSVCYSNLEFVKIEEIEVQDE